MSSLAEILAEYRALIPEIEGFALAGLPAGSLLDCRELDEVMQGRIPGSQWLAPSQLEVKIESLFPNKSQTIITYCESGVRSVFAAKRLLDLGYQRVKTLKGGIAEWKAANLPIDRESIVASTRYRTQMNLHGVGGAGQSQLSKAKVLVIGLGGLGSPTAMYLAAAGVGHLGLLDSDHVEKGNLHRQILHSQDTVGWAKVDSAVLRLRSLNSEVRLETIEQRLNTENIDQILPQFDLVLDGSDNFRTRYLLNEACLRLQKTLVQGSVLGFQGQVTVFGQPQGPCYRCLFPELPSRELQENCADNGVMGSVAGIVGCLMATEAIKLILKIGKPLSHQMLLVDGLNSSWQTLPVVRDPHCPSCSKKAQIKSYQEVLQDLGLS